MMRALAVVAILSMIAACAKGEETAATSSRDASPVESDPPAEPVGTGDPIAAGDDGGASSDAGGGGSCTGKIVVNELMAYGSAAADEFVELYNPSTCDVTIDGFKLSYKSSSGAPAGGSPLHTFAAGTTIAGKGYYVVGTSTFKGKKDAVFNGGGVTVNGGMAAEGQVALLDGAGTKMDSVGYGGVTGDYVETKPAPKAPASGSVARKADGVDTDDNSKDFDWMTTPTPGAKNGL